MHEVGPFGEVQKQDYIVGIVSNRRDASLHLTSIKMVRVIVENAVLLMCISITLGACARVTAVVCVCVCVSVITLTATYLIFLSKFRYH